MESPVSDDNQHRQKHTASNSDEGFREQEIRRIVVDELTKRMSPLEERLEKLHEWMLSFWSNGSNRPPGFFQMRVRQDDERYGRLVTETEAQSKVLLRLDDALQEIATEKRLEAERKERIAKRVAFWFPILKWVVMGLLSSLIALGTWACNKATPVVKILWDDYIKAHPLVLEQLRKTSQSSSPVVFANRKMTDASLPQTYDTRR